MYMLDHKTLIMDSAFMETETKSPFLRILINNINFFTVKKLIKAIAQNCTKTKGPMQNVIKSTEDHFSRINFDLGFEEGPTIWLPSLSTFALFLISQTLC